jgi:hypothetical protein
VFNRTLSYAYFLVVVIFYSPSPQSEMADNILAEDVVLPPAKKSRRCIGSENKLYVDKTSTGGKNSKVAVSRYKTYTGKGGVISGNNIQRLEDISNSGALSAYAQARPGTGPQEQRGSPTKEETFCKLECLIFKLLPESEACKMLGEWEAWDPEEPTDIKFKKLTVDEVLLLISICAKISTTGDGNFAWTDSVTGELMSVDTRNNGYKSVQKLLGAIREWTVNAGVVNSITYV